jgi:hypothetical protein
MRNKFHGKKLKPFRADLSLMRFADGPRIAFKAGRALSFCLALGFFLAVAFLLLFRAGFLETNLALFGEAVLALAAINIVFPRGLEAIRKNEWSRGMKDGSRLFADKLSLVIVWAGLSITYIVGVGLVFLLSRALGKTFLEIRPGKKQTYWVGKKKTGKSDEMF